jgi:Delta3-Delta2-enoyl-CoA isomerase
MLEIVDHGAVREVRLARPPANALNPELVEGLDRALAEAENAAQAIVISGLPGMFSAGLDVPELLQLDRDRLSRFWQDFTRVLKRIALSPVPTAFALTAMRRPAASSWPYSATTASCRAAPSRPA